MSICLTQIAGIIERVTNGLVYADSLENCDGHESIVIDGRFEKHEFEELIKEIIEEVM